MPSCKRNWKSRVFGFLGTAIAVVPCVAMALPVPGPSNPYLAGMPNGTLSLSGDAAPGQSPVLVPDLCLRTGSSLTFSATGAVSNDPNLVSYPLFGPDGNAAALTQHAGGPENGISNIFAPYDALVGVFLGASQPNLLPAPAMLDFSAAGSRNYLTLSPQLQQLFFIGNGLTSTSVIQHVVVPAGATRLYLGTLDVVQWSNNPGSFEVTVTDPCPTAIAAAAWGRVKTLFR